MTVCSWYDVCDCLYVFIACACGTSPRCTTCNSVPLDLFVMADKAAVGYVAISVFKYQRGTGFFRILVPTRLFYNGGKVV